MALSPRHAGELVEMPADVEFHDLLCDACKETAKDYSEPKTYNCNTCKRQFKTTVFQTGADTPQYPELCYNCVKDNSKCQCCPSKLKNKKDGCCVC